MPLEPFVAFLLMRHFRITLKKFSPHPLWEERLSYAMYGTIAVFVLQQTVLTNHLYQWIWHILLLVLIAATFIYDELQTARKVIYAILPLAVIGFIGDLIRLFSERLYNQYDNFSNYIYPVAFTWLFALLIVSRREQKALDKERQIRLEEEERNRIIAIQKSELETVVAQRTAELTQQAENLQHALTDLKATQTQLIQREKMASLGELTAGIAHEIQNPLNFVNNFAELSVELVSEIEEEINSLSVESSKKESLTHLLHDLVQNQQKINYHGKRADTIVKGMLQHSRSSTGQKEPTDINALVDEYVRLSYHGIRAKDKTFNAVFKTQYGENVGTIKVVPQEVGRVLLNLCNNAFYAAMQKKLAVKNGFEPTVWITTKRLKNKVEIDIKDNGTGIPQQALGKIFQPFFTTKPTGEGTGLGLSLSFDIITKGHAGELKVQTREGEGTEFMIVLPG